MFIKTHVRSLKTTHNFIYSCCYESVLKDQCVTRSCKTLQTNDCLFIRVRVLKKINCSETGCLNLLLKRSRSGFLWCCWDHAVELWVRIHLNFFTSGPAPSDIPLRTCWNCPTTKKRANRIPPLDGSNEPRVSASPQTGCHSNVHQTDAGHDPLTILPKPRPNYTFVWPFCTVSIWRKVIKRQETLRSHVWNLDETGNTFISRIRS